MSANETQVGGNHYKLEGSEDHWDFTWQYNYNQFEYCVSKYVDRHRRKNGEEDLKKAAHHLDKYIELAGLVCLTHRDRGEAIEWAKTRGADPSQQTIIEMIHIGELGLASTTLATYLKLLQEELPRTYVNPDL